MFGASSGLFLFCLVFVNVCEVRVTKPAQAPKTTKKTIFFPELWVHFGVVAGFFVFFWCLSMFGAFLFFCACQGFCKFHAKIMMKKHVLLRFWTLQMHKTAVFTVFYHHF